MIVTDGGFRPDGTFVHWPTHDPGRLAEAFRRAVLRLFVWKELFEMDQAEAMLQWPHSGFHVHDAVWVAEEDRPFALRLTRYYGWYANRTRGIRHRAGGADVSPPVVFAAPVPLPHQQARRRWAELLRRIFEVDPLVCPRCGGGRCGSWRS